jgi:hypothetical protein
MQSKNGDAYIHALNEMIAAADWKLNATSKTCDFETALKNAVEMQFAGQGPSIFCFFI